MKDPVYQRGKTCTYRLNGPKILATCAQHDLGGSRGSSDHRTPCGCEAQTAAAYWGNPFGALRTVVRMLRRARSAGASANDAATAGTQQESR